MPTPEPRNRPFVEPSPAPLLDLILNARPEDEPRAAPAGPLVGECRGVDPAAGRVLVQPLGEPAGEGRWLGLLAGLDVREGDRVLLVRPANWPEPLVVGALATSRGDRHSPAVRVTENEPLRVVGPTGTPLVEVAHGESGPLIRLLADGVRLDAAGPLDITADRIRLEARAGEVRVKASEDVVVQGEVIHLN